MFMRDGTGIVDISRNWHCRTIDDHRSYKQPASGGCVLHLDLFKACDWLVDEVIVTPEGGSYATDPVAVVSAVWRVARRQRRWAWPEPETRHW